jgi:arsenite methyltransferase
VVGTPATFRAVAGCPCSPRYAREEIAANYCAHRWRSHEYVADLPRALAELHRVLRLGGRALVDTDWDSLVWHINDRESHRRITAARDAHLVHPHLPKVLARLRTAGFTVTAQRVHVLLNTELTENSFSAFDMRAVAKYVPGHHGLTGADAEAWVTDLKAQSDADKFFYSLNRYIVMATA